jgi:prepilin-type N-terminal cleavage/methylation domain-containing protein
MACQAATRSKEKSIFRRSLALKELAVKRIYPRSAGRAGFTLIEMLVVIAIIAIVASLTVAAVFGLMRNGPKMVTKNDFLQISGAMEQFKGKFGFYPPEKVRLCSNYAQYNPANPLDASSLQAINRVFSNLGQFNGVKWAGPNSPANLDVTLEGDQSVVFWLGGPPATPTTLMGGFALIPTDPIDAGYTKPDRLKFMTFDAGRLTTAARAGNNASAYFPSFLDGFRKGPYVYFSSGARANGYTGVANTLGVSAYLQTANPPTFQNSTTFQIIAPGGDGLFGTGGAVWPPPQTGHGADDMSNFTDVELGKAP